MSIRKNRHSTPARVLAALLLAFASFVAQAQNYPQRPVRLIVPFAAGGITDAAARFFAHYAGEKLGQSLIVENRGGGGGTVGSAVAARANPDGYTLLFSSVETYGMTYADQKKLTYSPEKDFTPIAVIARGANAFVVHPSVKATTIQELVALARANPGKLRYCSPGVGSNPHIIGEMFKKRFNLDIVHVPYKGGGAGVIDVVSGTIEMCVLGGSTAAPRVKAGQLRGLAVTSGSRSPLMPDVPTMAQAGVNDFVLGPLFLLVAPAGTPADIVARLTRDTVAVSQMPEFRNRLVEIGSEAVEPVTGDAFNRQVLGEAQRWREMAELAGLKDE
jgi:tripartite-type tricarboxylate transporter receptor subunit TctC